MLTQPKENDGTMEYSSSDLHSVDTYEFQTTEDTRTILEWIESLQLSTRTNGEAILENEKRLSDLLQKIERNNIYIESILETINNK